ncbi:fosmidomycin resistance protein [Halobacteriales archaeon QS_1_68_17]|nr:MAG: fosmidomycin resistance protein [Halobacteriales archaeon QS_1_68_17]
MLTGLGWLALEVKYLDRAASFYRQFLDLDTVRENEREVALAAGDTDLVLRRPGGVPRGDQFGSARSLYFYDTEGNCVEIGQRGGDGSGITGVFEVVLEVADLEAAESFYADLGFEVVDRGRDRKRVRLTAGPFDFELWEPHLGLADARGGVHVDVGFETDDPEAAADRVAERTRGRERLSDGSVRVTDPDGHSLTFR